MVTLATIPARFHAALAEERVDTEAGPLLELRRGDAVIYTGDLGARRYDPAVLTLPPTDRNVRALAVVLAQACGLDVSRGVLARLTGDRLLWLEVNTSTGGVDLARAGFAPRPWRPLHRGCPALATIDPTAPDALFRALCACLCALETA